MRLWGNMLSDSRQYLVIAPWMMLVPAVTIVWSVISLNLIGDGIAELSRKRARAVSMTLQTEMERRDINNLDNEVILSVKDVVVQFPSQKRKLLLMLLTVFLLN